MDRNEKLKRYLLDTGRLAQDQVARAEDYALTMNLSLDESIAFLQLMDYSALGKSWEEIYGIPYQPLLESPCSHEAKQAIPLSLAERLMVFPIGFDSTSQSFLVAMDDPTDETKTGHLARVLPSHIKLKLLVASRPEIMEAIGINYKGKKYAPKIEVQLPEEFTISIPKKDKNVEPALQVRGKKKAVVLEPDLDRYRAIRGLLKAEGVEVTAWVQTPKELSREKKIQSSDMILVNGEKYRPGGPWTKEVSLGAQSPIVSFYYPRAMLLGQEHPYGAVSEALISLVAFIIKKALKKEPQRLEETIARVRYCKLLSLKLGLTPAQVDAVVLAAWLSGSHIGDILARSIDTPYALGEIISSGDQTFGPSKRIEAQVLSLVNKYLEIKKVQPEALKDIDGIRTNLGKRGDRGPTRQLLESFLHVIRDEGLLRGIGEEKRSILIIGEGFNLSSDVVLCLQSDGFKVSLLTHPSEAMEKIALSPPDAVLCKISTTQMAGVQLCAMLRNHSEFSQIPFFFLAPSDSQSLATECLRAGADDFITEPFEPDLLVLKLSRAISARAQRHPKKGIEGSLEDMSAMDIIQSVATGDKNVKITLESNGQRGNIFIRDGQIIHAEAGVLIGQEAFFHLMSFQSGEFKVVSCSSFPQQTIHASTMSLLMEGARLLDEASARGEV